eukprot:TRINITY_DN55561_c0_g1_i1.p1 TRINITY_DN55561_c0_g1~~TRINITY_DN55561_c0_g1_i1.p1  ORF type:complete len:286 (-),score=23.52 TRINITY_DN55561_c0_g1_i1:522-1259(-)
MVWNRIAGPGRGRLDPNYLTQSQYSKSPWHRALHRWALSAGHGGPASGEESVPLFHVDLHGKVSEKLHLDLGAAPLEEIWPTGDQQFVGTVKRHMSTTLDKALSACNVRSLKGKQIKVDVDPRLHGYWGADTVTTISHQSVLLGVPAVQFEMPPRLREQFVQSTLLGQRFAAAIAEVYHEVVTPWWIARSNSMTPWPRYMKLEPKLAADVEESGPSGNEAFEEWSNKLLEELLQAERTLTSEVQI